MTDQHQAQPEKKPRQRKPKGRGHGEGSVYERKSDTVKRNKPWVAQIPLGTGKTKSLYFKTQKEAQQALRKALNEQEQGMLITERDQKVGPYLEHWLEHIHRPHIRLTSYRRYQAALYRHIVPALGHIPLRRLTSQDINVFYAQQQKEKQSARSIHVMHALLHKALDDAMQAQPPLVARNVSDAAKLPHILRADQQFLTQEQAHILLEAAKGHRFETLLILALTTGMRRGELVALRWQDIDFEHRCLHVRQTANTVSGYGIVVGEPKTEASRRRIMLHPFVLETLKLHRETQEAVRLKAGGEWQDNNLVFCNEQGAFYRPQRVLTQFQAILRDAGLPHLRFHSLRHSAATILLAKGVNPKVVQSILGHSSFQMTMDTYSHVLPDQQEDAMSKWDDLF
ncbi:MAG: tyrosine-type recombinase/integrase [Ktedonobacteraceae bacterium]|nr:tyrosine-type recombinase/integrase [Ktedonobacteraceae bacterium]